MSETSAARTFDVRHVQLARALFAVIAAIMITFSPDHSAVVGLAVFSGFAIATGIVHLLAVWLVYPAGARWPSLLLGIVTVAAGMLGGLGPMRTVTGFFAIIVVWAIVSGIIEAVSGILAQRRARAALRPETVAAKPGQVAPWSGGTTAPPMPRTEARDALIVGIVGLVLGIALLCVPTGYALQYTIEDAPEPFILTGIIIGVGLFGAYAAIVAVYLGIAGFSPRHPAPVATDDPAAAVPTADQKDHA